MSRHLVPVKNKVGRPPGSKNNSLQPSVRPSGGNAMVLRPKQPTNWDDVPIVMDLYKAAYILGVSYDNLKKRALRGDFPAYKENGHAWRIGKDTLRAYVDQRLHCTAPNQYIFTPDTTRADVDKTLY